MGSNPGRAGLLSSPTNAASSTAAQETKLLARLLDQRVAAREASVGDSVGDRGSSYVSAAAAAACHIAEVVQAGEARRAGWASSSTALPLPLSARSPLPVRSPPMDQCEEDLGEDPWGCGLVSLVPVSSAAQAGYGWMQGPWMQQQQQQRQQQQQQQQQEQALLLHRATPMSPSALAAANAVTVAALGAVAGTPRGSPMAPSPTGDSHPVKSRWTKPDSKQWYL